jgi:hypothetical protein
VIKIREGAEQPRFRSFRGQRAFGRCMAAMVLGRKPSLVSRIQPSKRGGRQFVPQLVRSTALSVQISTSDVSAQ